MTKVSLAILALAVALVVHTGRADASCDTVGSYNSSTWNSCNSDVSHAGIYSSGCYGRCGPACNWSVLGNVYTNACKTHDWCVRDGLAKGRSKYSAHSNCVGSLGSAARSWFSHNWHTWKGKIRDKVTGFISNWL